MRELRSHLIDRVNVKAVCIIAYDGNNVAITTSGMTYGTALAAIIASAFEKETPKERIHTRKVLKEYIDNIVKVMNSEDKNEPRSGEAKGTDQGE